MPQVQNYASTIDVLADRAHSNDHYSSKSRPEDTADILRRYSLCIEEICPDCTEEIRQQQVYEALEQDVAEWMQIGVRLENDTFGLPQNSRSDVVGYQNNDTPTLPSFSTAYPEYHDSLTAHFTRSSVLDSTDSHLANEVILPAPIARPTSYQCHNFACSSEKGCRQPQAHEGFPSGSSCSGDDMIFWCASTDEDVWQARFSRDQSTMNPISPAISTSVHFSRSAQHHQNSYNACLLQNLDKFVTSQFNPESNSIHDIGCAKTKVVIQDARSERAYASSQSGEILEASTQGLMRDNQSNEVEVVQQEESDDRISSKAINEHATTNENTISIERNDYIVGPSTIVAIGSPDSGQAVVTENQDNEPSTFDELEDLRDGTFMPHNGRNFADRELFGYSLLQAMQSQHCSDQEDKLPSDLDYITQPAIHPDFDAPSHDVAGFVRSFSGVSEIRQAIHDLGEPRHLSQLALGQPQNSSIIKRRTKRSTCGSGRPSQQFLNPTIYGQDLTTDIASFVRVNSRYKSVDLTRPLQPVPISKKPTYTDSPRVKKRSARESFDLVDLCHENIEKAHREGFQQTLRGSFDLIELYHENIARDQSRKKARLDITPSTPISARLPTTPRSTGSSHFDGSPMATALKGYPGQFEIHKSRAISQPTKPTSPTKHVFGNHLHANGEIINLDFIPDSSPNNLDLSELTDISSILEQANLHHTFAEEILRSREEDSLRREAYRECAAARLEGVPVGVYRYFAGHMTVEEYNEAKICICWGRCWCTKLCTHFGDLACPCAEDLVIGEEI